MTSLVSVARELAPFSGLKYKYSVVESGSVAFLRVESSFGAIEDLPLSRGAKPPRTGLLLAEALPWGNGKSLLDIGTGEHAFLALFALRLLGYGSALATDVDSASLEKAVSVLKRTGEGRLSVGQSDIFCNVKACFGVMVSNPPFTPKPAINYMRSAVHDFGGATGYAVISRIIEGAQAHLRPDGELYIIMAEYLGIEQKLGEPECVFEQMRQNGLSPERVLTKQTAIRSGGATQLSLDRIMSVYPACKFSISGTPTADLQQVKEAIMLGEKVLYNLVVVRGKA